MIIKMDIRDRIQRAAHVRAALADPRALTELARDLLAATPAACTHLVAFSDEGQAVASAASVLALGDGRDLAVQRASHLAPLHPGPEQAGWRWMSVEQALGFGPVRPWVARWAQQRGGEQPLEPSVGRHLAQVA